MRAAIEEALIYVKEPVSSFLVHACQTPEAVAHEAVFGIHRLQALQGNQGQ